jgi:hypothetical protein
MQRSVFAKAFVQSPLTTADLIAPIAEQYSSAVALEIHIREITTNLKSKRIASSSFTVEHHLP